MASGSACSVDDTVESSRFYSASGVRLSDSDDSQTLESLNLSQGGTVYRTPIVDPSLKPVVGMSFRSIEDAQNFYYNYAASAGFVVRIMTTHRDGGKIKLRRFVCNRQGFKGPTLKAKQRSVASFRFGCPAYLTVAFDIATGFYKYLYFEEQHTHEFVLGGDKQFMSSSRKLNKGHKKFVMDCQKASIGPVRCHRIFKEIVGSYDQVGASAVDFKNYRRDMLAYIAGSDAHMTINKFLKKKEFCPAFFFDYDVDCDDRLTRLFWADPICRKNYSIFGDVVSFDATYRTNRYNLIFIPFTGLDHHKSSVTFDCGLIFMEDSGSYVWLLKKFKEAMVFAPKIIVTDQDASMKSAIEIVFPESFHRLCMWHIMKKIPAKTKYDGELGDEFRTRLNKIVWTDQLEPAEFESLWNALLEEFPLVKRKWFDDMYAIRRSWIPAYFRDIMFGGLLRTTSIFESTNSFYGNFNDRYYRLVELVMNFDIGLDTQRHTQNKLNSESTTMHPDLSTLWSMEEHAAEVYTLSIFSIVKDEIVSASTSCCIVSISGSDESKIYGIKDGDFKVCSVYHSIVDEEFRCSCRLFQKMGHPCRHLFLVFRNLGFKKIPSKYILSRWTKSAIISPVFTIDDTVVKQCLMIEEREQVVNKLISDFYSCVGLVEDNVEELKLLSDYMQQKKELLLSQSVEGSSGLNSNQADLEKYCGVEIPNVVNVHPPDHAKNKGSGSHSRIRSGKEVAMESSEPKKRRCRRCNKFATHNSRTCNEVLPP